MNIVFFCDTFYPAHNGILNSVVNYANGLSERGHNVLIVAPFHPRAKLEPWNLDSKVQIHLQPSLPFGLYPDFRFFIPTPNLLHTIKKFQPDIIHNHYVFVASMVGLCIAKSLRVNSIVTCNTHFDHPDTISFLKLPNNKLTLYFQSLLLKYVAVFFKQHDLVLSSSQSIARYLANFKVDSKRVVLPVPHYRLIKARKSGRELKEGLGYGQSVLFVGRLSREKRVDKLIDFFKKLHASKPSLSLIIIGDGPDKQRLQN